MFPIWMITREGGGHAVKYRSRLIGNNCAILASSALSFFHSFCEPNSNTQIWDAVDSFTQDLFVQQLPNWRGWLLIALEEQMSLQVCYEKRT